MVLSYFLIYLFLEVLVSLSIASYLGVVLTFLEIIASAVLGGLILANYGRSTYELIYMLQKKEISQEEFLTNRLFSCIGAFLLIVPGFLTDIIGFLLQFELSAKFFAKFFIKKQSTYKGSFSDRESEIIDVEIEEKKGDI